MRLLNQRIFWLLAAFAFTKSIVIDGAVAETAIATDQVTSISCSDLGRTYVVINGQSGAESDAYTVSWFQRERGIDIENVDDDTIKSAINELQKCTDNDAHDFAARSLEIPLAFARGIIIERRVAAQKTQYFAELQNLPLCGDENVLQALVDSVANSPTGKAGTELIKVTNATDITRDLLAEGNAASIILSSPPARRCAATGFFNIGKIAFRYHVEWMDKSKGQFWVQVDQ